MMNCNLGRLDEVKNLVENIKVDIEAKNREGKTALYLASWYGKMNF